MSSDARRRVPLAPSYAPLETVTTRRIYIQNLVNVLELAVLGGQWERAYRVWAILIRCPEADYKRAWRYGLAVLAHPPPSAALSSTHEADLPAERDEKREAYLRRLLSAVRKEQRPDVLQALVLELVRVGKYEEALDELELYLPSYPYLTAPSLHTYAGLVCVYLALPRAARGGVWAGDPEPARSRAGEGPVESSGPAEHASLRHPHNASAPRSASPLPSPSPAPSSSRSSSFPSSAPQARLPAFPLGSAPGSSTGPRLDPQMERGLLRRAQGFLQAAVDLARREGGSGEDDEIEADNGYERGGIAAMYLAQVKAVLAGQDPTQVDASRHRTQSQSHSPFQSQFQSQSNKPKPAYYPSSSSSAPSTPTQRSYRSPSASQLPTTPSISTPASIRRATPDAQSPLRARTQAAARADVPWVDGYALPSPSRHVHERSAGPSEAASPTLEQEERWVGRPLEGVDDDGEDEDEDEEKSQYSDLSYG